MTAIEIYQNTIKPLSVDEKLTIARLIMDDVVPPPTETSEEAYRRLKAILPNLERLIITDRDLAGIGIEDLPG